MSTLCAPSRGPADRQGARPQPGPELDDAFKAYNENPFEGFRAEGAAPDARRILPEYLNKKRCSYHLFRWADSVGVNMAVKDEALKETAKLFVGATVANGQGKLVWYESPVAGRSRVEAEFPLDTPAETIAQAMRDLLSMTKAPITEKLQQLYGPEKAPA